MPDIATLQSLKAELRQARLEGNGETVELEDSTAMELIGLIDSIMDMLIDSE